MRVSSLLAPVLLATALGLTVANSPAGAHVMSPDPGEHALQLMPAKKACLNNPGPDGGTWVNSQDFGPPDQNYVAAASDFRVRSRCVITVITVDGYFFNGSGPDSFHVVIYRGDGPSGTPGAVMVDQSGMSYTYDGNHAILSPSKITLTTGRYWISVVADATFADGTWGWKTSSTKTGRPDLWVDPSGAQGCQTWGTFKHCLGVTPANLIITAGR